MARKVNTRFLIILTVLVVGLGAAALVAGVLLLRDDPQEYIDAGRRSLAEGKYDLANRNFGHALSIDGTNAEVWVLRGDALYNLVAEDDENLANARACWNRALELEPQNREALTRLAEHFLEALDRFAGQREGLGEQFRFGMGFAQRLARVAPEDSRAVSLQHLYTIRASLRGVALDGGRRGDGSQLDAAIAALRDLAADDPTNPELPFYAARGLLQQAQTAARLNQLADAEYKFNVAADTMAKAADAQPENVRMQHRAAIVYDELARFWPADSEQGKRAQADFLPRMKAQMDRAAALVQPGDEEYLEISLAAAFASLRLGDAEEALARVRDVHARFPDDQRVRIRFAEMLRLTQDGVAEALQVLAKPIVPRHVEGLDALAQRNEEVQTLLLRAEVRMDLYAGADAAEKQVILDAANDDLDKVTAVLSANGASADHPLVLRIKGKIQRLQNRPEEAVKTLRLALSQLEAQQAASGSEAYLYDTIEQLAHAYYAMDQYGDARALLERLLARNDKHLPSRQLLALILLRQRDVEAAREHVRFVTRALPGTIEAIKLELLTLDKDEDEEQIRTLVARLPEETRRERREKIAAAASVELDDEVERLLEAMLADNPADPDASVSLAMHYSRTGRRDEALRVLDEAIRTSPSSPLLTLTRREIAGASPAEIRDAQEEVLGQIDDPASRELAMARLETRGGNHAAALAHLEKANELRPKDKTVLEALLGHHLMVRDWARAEAVIGELTALNADLAGGAFYQHALAMAQGDYRGAIGHATTVTSRMGEFARSWVLLGQAHQAAGEHEEAMQRYDQALEKEPSNIDALRGQIEASLALGRSDDARQHIDLALKRHPSHPAFTRALREWELAYGDPEKAIGPLEQATVDAPDDRATWIRYGEATLEAARASERQNRTAEAQAFGRRTLEAGQKMVELFPDDRAGYAMLAQGALASGQIADAEAALRAMAGRPAWQGKPEPQMMLGEVYARAGMAQEAEAVLRPVFGQFPDRTESQLMLAELYARRGRVDEALAVLTVNNDNPDVLRRRIELQINTGQLNQADENLTKALEQSPDSAELRALHGFVHLARNRWDEAAAQLSQALSLDPESNTAAYYLAVLKLRQPVRDVDGAVALLTAARDRDPGDADIRFTLAQAYELRNSRAEAIRELEAGVQQQPANKKLRLALVNLYRSSVPPRWRDAERTLTGALALEELKNDPDLLLAEALMWDAREEHEKALNRISAALASAPNSIPLVQAQLQVMLGAGDHPGVIRRADEVLAVADELWWAHAAKARARSRSGDRDGAIQDFEAALTAAAAAGRGGDAASSEVIAALADEIGVDAALERVAPKAQADPRWRLIEAQLHSSKGDLDGAEAAIETVLADLDALPPADQLVALRFAGSLYLGRGDARSFAKARDAYERLLGVNPDDVLALNNLAWLLAEGLETTLPAEALAHSQRAYDLVMKTGRPDPVVLDTHGWVLVLNDRLDDGIAVLTDALSVGQQALPDTHYHLAEAYLRKQFPAEADRQLGLAEELIERILQENGRVEPSLQAKIQNARQKVSQMLDDDREASIR